MGTRTLGSRQPFDTILNHKMKIVLIYFVLSFLSISSWAGQTDNSFGDVMAVIESQQSLPDPSLPDPVEDVPSTTSSHALRPRRRKSKNAAVAVVDRSVPSSGKRRRNRRQRATSGSKKVATTGKGKKKANCNTAAVSRLLDSRSKKISKAIASAEKQLKIAKATAKDIRRTKKEIRREKRKKQLRKWLRFALDRYPHSKLLKNVHQKDLWKILKSWKTKIKGGSWKKALSTARKQKKIRELKKRRATKKALKRKALGQRKIKKHPSGKKLKKKQRKRMPQKKALKLRK